PMGWGCLRPTVVLPADAAQWPPEQTHAALLHELAHLKRQDWLALMFTHIVCALYWFHPLVWFAARQAHRESEHASDDLVLAAGIGQADYAGHLLSAARSARSFRAAPFTAVALVRPSALNRRLSAILAPHSHRRGRTRTMMAVAAAFMAACVCPLATLRPVEAAGPISSELRGPVVVVDAGHGGRDTGGVGPGGVTEKALALAIAERLRTELEQRGATVYMTREGDTFPALLERAQFANAKHANYLISVHCDIGTNQSYSPADSGVYYHGKDLLGRRLAESVGQGLRQATDKSSGVVSDTSRFRTGFAILREAHMPSVLVECGNMTNPSSLARLRDATEQQRIAEGIAIGLSAFQKSHRKNSR
ncbi:MAG: M56/M15 family metallopeptidase, partial [Armatimonadota bacterium]|nr:M56/M15 family metallopeptidase [Armatimonadota bacterium]